MSPIETASGGVAARIGHTFAHDELLREALTHRSFGTPHNERLEFLGDAVLNCAVAAELFHRLPDAPEGALTRLRANLVNRDTLHDIARALALGPAIRLGEGERRSGGQERPSILADALESVIGAVYLDAGFPQACAVIARLFAARFAEVDADKLGKDPKTRLQEDLQGRRLPLPVYSLLRIEGQAHQQLFFAECVVEPLGLRSEGQGPSRRAAEQAAAQALIALLR